MLVEVGDQSGKPTGQASGVVIRSDGIVATNAHVLKGACKVSAKVGPDGPSLSLADVVFFNEGRDIAILRFFTDSKLHAATVGNSRSLEVGQKVVAIGSPMGLERTVSEGIVSGIRELENGKVIQFTAPISPGSSGGGLFTATGRLVGITAFSLKGAQTINFAVPIEDFVSRTGEKEVSWKSISAYFCSQNTQELDYALFVGILGRELFDPLVQETLKKLNGDIEPIVNEIEPKPFFPVNVRDYLLFKAGLSIQFVEGIGDYITLYTRGAHIGSLGFGKRPTTFRGRLPLNLSWNETRASVLKKLGPPKHAQSMRPGDTVFLGWYQFDTYEIGSYRFHLSYTQDELLGEVGISRREP